MLFKTLFLTVLLYYAEAWNLLSIEAAALSIFERYVPSKIFGPVRIGVVFRIRSYSELYEFLNDIGAVQHINIQRLRGLGRFIRIGEYAPAERVFDAGICNFVPVSVTNWRRRAKRRSDGKNLLRQAEIR